MHTMHRQRHSYNTPLEPFVRNTDEVLYIFQIYVMVLVCCVFVCICYSTYLGYPSYRCRGRVLCPHSRWFCKSSRKQQQQQQKQPRLYQAYGSKEKQQRYCTVQPKTNTFMTRSNGGHHTLLSVGNKDSFSSQVMTHDSLYLPAALEAQNEQNSSNSNSGDDDSSSSNYDSDSPFTNDDQKSYDGFELNGYYAANHGKIPATTTNTKQAPFNFNSTPTIITKPGSDVSINNSRAGPSTHSGMSNYYDDDDDDNDDNDDDDDDSRFSCESSESMDSKEAEEEHLSAYV